MFQTVGIWGWQSRGLWLYKEGVKLLSSSESLAKECETNWNLNFPYVPEDLPSLTLSDMKV